MPAFVPGRNAASNVGAASPRRAGGDNASLGAKMVTVFGGNHDRGLPSHLASIVLMDPETGALRALLDGRFITEARTAAVSAVASRHLARKTAATLAIIGTGVQARSHLEALSRVHRLRDVTVWSPNPQHVADFAAWCQARDGYVTGTGQGGDGSVTGTGRGGDGCVTGEGQVRVLVRGVAHAGEAVVGADLIVLATSSPTPVVENAWVKPGAHVMSVGACRPNQREMDPDLVARARLFVDSRAAALVESGDVVMGINEGRFTPQHIVAEIGELVNGAEGRRTDAEVTIFKSLGMAVEDVTAADLAFRRAVERGIGKELWL
jgi:ornithine cyclodeaminase